MLTVETPGAKGAVFFFPVVTCCLSQSVVFFGFAGKKNTDGKKKIRTGKKKYGIFFFPCQ